MLTTLDKPTVWTDTDRRMMTRALELARKGVGQVSPGPLVGCVVVNPSGEIVGEGFYVFEEIKHEIVRYVSRLGKHTIIDKHIVGLLRSRITKHRIGRQAVQLPYVVSLINIVKIPNIDD